MTAQQEYTKTRLEIAKELKKLEENLFNHNQETDKINWGHVGDMKYILNQLQELNGEEE